MIITVQDMGAVNNPSAIEYVSVRVQTSVDTTPVSIVLPESAPGSGTFSRQVAFQRSFDALGRPLARDSDKIGIYAEGDKVSDTVAVVYGLSAASSISKTATFEEPTSTLTGVLKAGGATVAHAAVQLTQPGGFKLLTTSRGDGSYSFYDLASGTYTLVAAADGAQQLTSTVTIP